MGGMVVFLSRKDQKSGMNGANKYSVKAKLDLGQAGKLGEIKVHMSLLNNK